jgi:transporter family-2 protein
MDAVYVALSLVAGALLAVQAGANAQLSKAVESPFAATTLQLFVAAALLLAVALLTGSVAALWLLPRATWWHVLGGTASAFYVVSTILLLPRIGAVTAIGLVITGQVLASVVLDTFGLVGVPVVGWQVETMVGAALVILGGILIVYGQRAGTEARRQHGGWIVLAIMAGAVLPVQGAVNGLLRQDLGGAAFAVGVVSFVVAALSMGGVLMAMRGLPGGADVSGRADRLSSMPWWGWLGGFAGATYVTTVFSAIPVIGAAATVGLTVAGQQITSLFVDIYGWFRLPRRPVGALRLMGVVTLLVGVATIKLA